MKLHKYLIIIFSFQFLINSCQIPENEQVNAIVYEIDRSENGVYLGVEFKNSSSKEVNAMKTKLIISDVFDEIIKEQVIKLDDLEGELKSDSVCEMSIMIDLTDDAFKNLDHDNLKFSMVIEKVIYKE